jgi:E3 ubiquitin-protein ligase UBR3
MSQSNRKYEEAVRLFPSPDPPEEYEKLPALGKTLVHKTLLEEFIFWTFKYEFPQNVVCLLLNMLPDQEYKEHLTRTFVMHYSRIPSVLEMSEDPDTMSNRVVHVSVQLFSNEALALKMVEELNLLHVMIISLKSMVSKILIPNTLNGEYDELLLSLLPIIITHSSLLLLSLSLTFRSRKELSFRSGLREKSNERALLLAISFRL